MEKNSMELSGSLTQFQFSDIVQFLGMSYKNGMLSIIRSNGEQAAIYFKEGNLLHASCGEKDGIKAFEDTFNWQNGTFYFQSNHKPDRASINAPVSFLLLEVQKRRDELVNLFSKLPPEDTVLYIVPYLDEVPHLNSLDWHVLSAINGKRSIHRICQKLGDELNVKKIILSLLEKGVITTVSPDASFFDLVPRLRTSTEFKGDRPFPPHIRTNLLLKSINGLSTIRELGKQLKMEDNDLIDDIKVLYDLKWIAFSDAHKKVFKALREDL